MKFTNITISNFRNFEEVSVELNNKNVFFGMNDVGKTNFLYAIRFVFDKEIRRNGCVESDYFQKRVSLPLKIIIKIDISDNDEDSQKLRAKIKGGLSSDDDFVYIKLEANYDEKEGYGNPILSWGGKIENLIVMNSHGNLLDIDYVFNPIYIDAYVDIYNLFKKNTKKLIINDENSNNDIQILEQIKSRIKELNYNVSSLSGISKFQNDVTTEYKKYHDENISISIKSEIAIKGLYSNIIPYIRTTNDDSLYPTSGEGRKKLLVYSIYGLLSKLNENTKINVYLVEEPENHLHKSMQIGLSKTIFYDIQFRYLFLTTHSPYILNEMDNVNLVRLFNQEKILGKSVFYSVPNEYKNIRKYLNNTLAEAIFSSVVLLVEGPSEEILFRKVLSEVNDTFEINGGIILSVNGIGFNNYFPILNSLKIKNIIKTDNDLRKQGDKYMPIGFSRINKYINENKLPLDLVDNNTVEEKRKLFERNKNIIQDINYNYKIYISKCSLEEDLDEVIHQQMVKYLGSNPVDFLKEAKSKNMVNLTNKLTKDDCLSIYEHSNFACLKEFVKDVN